MRRNITLYLGTERADLPDGNLVLFNFALSNLTNPAVQKNSWSQQVTLPRTPDNDRILGESFRLDRTAGPGGTGTAFNASRKTPFSIYASSGEVLASGYAKLDEVNKDGYAMTLYGGLGELVYNLSYDADGNKKTLASLDYGVDLDFTINAQTIRDAWRMLSSGYILISPTASVNKSVLYQGGNVGASGNASRVVNTYDVEGGKTYLVSCETTGINGSAGAVAYDSGGNVLQWWYSGETYHAYVDVPITLPAGTTTLRLQGYTGLQDAVLKYVDDRWNIVNFAPCYNGIPSDFSADKAIATPANVSIPSQKTESGTTYDAANTGGYTLVTFPEALDEWAVKDFRSYLQRPVLKVWKLLQAIADPANNGGWTIDLTDINNLISFPYQGAWLTRPLLPSLGTYKQTAGVASISGSSPWTTGSEIIEYTISGANAGDIVNARMTFKPTYDIDDAGGAADLLSYTIAAGYAVRMVTFIQAIAYDSNNLKLAASKTLATYKGTDTLAVTEAAQMCGYTPDNANTEFASPVEETPYSLISTDTYQRDGALTLEVEAADIDHIEVITRHYTLTTKADGSKLLVTSSAILYDGQTPRAIDQQCATDYSGTATTLTGETLRSGARITKEMLLTTDGTPADYLLALCKVFGLYLLTDSATKTAQLVRRNTLYQNEVIDLTGRVDRSREMSLLPCSFDARWYDFKLEGSGGAFEKEYKDAEGVQYGIQRVDTNYDFDANAKDVLSGAVLKSCAAVVDMSKYWCYAVNSGDYSPAPFLYAGCVQTLWDAAGEGEDFSIPVASTAGLVQYNNSFPFHDAAQFGRAEFRDKDNKGAEGADCLLIYNGTTTMDHMTISDDSSAMTTLNGGSPCWVLDAGATVNVPDFSRVYYDQLASVIRGTLDLGAPRQTAVAGMSYPANKTIYALAWRNYIADRLNASGKVLRCRVRWDGLQVGPELLRKFYWYGGSLWVLNEIKNYSLTTFDPAECEFIQVRDKSAYTNGQY